GPIVESLHVAHLWAFALGDYQSDIIVLFTSAELLNIMNNRRQQGLRREVARSPQGFDQALFSELLFSLTKGFGYAVTVEYERVSWRELAFLDRAIPFLEESQNGGRGLQPFKSVIPPEDEGGEMPAIRVTQALRLVIVFGEEQRSVGA